MRKRNLYIVILFLIIGIGISCKKDILNTVPYDAYSNAVLWSSQSDAQAALNGCYANWEIGDDVVYPDTYSDNGYSRYYWEGWQDYGNGSITASDTRVNTWWNYTTIQQCNWFIANIDKTPMADSVKKVFKSEARFIRAYKYFYMSQLYGGVPLVTTNITTQQANTISRTPYNDIRQFILNELDTIAPILPVQWDANDVGRITRGAALALKARIELYDKKYSDCIADCQQVMQLGYALFPSYQDLFRIQNENNSEVILDIQNKENDKQTGLVGVMSPKDYGGWGSIDPTQELVDSYEMNNGKTIDDPASGYDPNNPYTGRDPRLTESVLCPGQMYMGTYFNSIDPNSSGYYLLNANSLTGYYPKKFIANINDYTSIWNTGLNFIVIRYAEVLLSYAEAKIESGQIDNSVYDAIDAVRTRAGMPKSDRTAYAAQDQLRTLIRRERRSELALEGLRWFDIQRWQIGPQVRAGSIHGIRTGAVDPNTGKLTFAGQNVFIENRLFNPNANYLFPVPQSEININKNLTQNPGY